MYNTVFSYFCNCADKFRSNKIKILLVDDHKMFRNTLRRIIEKQNDLIIIGEASDGKEALKLAHEADPDVITMDINMPRMNGIRATREITTDFPETRIIGLSMNNKDTHMEEMINAGASAYLQKTEVNDSLIKTIRAKDPAR